MEGMKRGDPVTIAFSGDYGKPRWIRIRWQ
jgi:hypothetical protein